MKEQMRILLAVLIAPLFLLNGCIFLLDEEEECCDEWGCYECSDEDYYSDNGNGDVSCDEDWQCGPGCICVDNVCIEHGPDGTPITDGPVPVEPDAGEPVAGEPSAAEGDAAEPDAGEPDAGEPDAGEPDAGEPDVEPPPAYRYALIEDLTSPVAGEFPGIDGDYIRLTKADGTVHYASGLIDSNIGVEGNSAADPNQIIGAPDANCDANSGAFTSLGGLDADAYVIVEFGDAADVTIENGDTIVVGDLGATDCNGMFDDDPGRLGVSVGTDRGSFTTIGEFDGAAEVPITGLE